MSEKNANAVECRRPDTCTRTKDERAGCEFCGSTDAPASPAPSAAEAMKAAEELADEAYGNGNSASDPCTAPDCDCEPGFCREKPRPKRTKGVTDGVATPAKEQP